LRHEDLRVLDVTPMERSSGDAVRARLEAVAQRTGPPRGLLSDGGTDLAKAAQQFQSEHPGVARLYDIKHKTALLLRHRLERDPRWSPFLQQATVARARLQLTAASGWRPPALKTKARYMNLAALLRWGQRTLDALDHPRPLSGRRGEEETLRRQLGWLTDYREALYLWSVYLAIAETAETLIRQEGYHAQAAATLARRLAGLALDRPAATMIAALEEFVAAQSAAARPGEALPGSSEVLESLLGKYKSLQGTSSPGGVTPLVLALGAMVQRLTPETIRAALGTIRTHDVLRWCQSHLDVPLAALRRRADQEQHHPTTPMPRAA
jgi:hypothetical protein